MTEDLLILTRFVPSFVEEEPLHRPRLLERLFAHRDARLVVVQAPAGAGKTTLLYDYVRSCPTPVAWLSLHETDRDPRLFASYLVEGLARRYDVPFSSRSLLSHAASTEAILTALVNDLVGLAGRGELILDDLHFVSDKTSIVELLAFLLHQAPRGFRILATSRETPPAALRLAHLRSKGVAVILGPEELRFNRQEVADLVRSRWPQCASDRAVGLLLEKTEGWVTGIELLHQSLSNRSESEVTDRLLHLDPGQGLIFDYLAEEILSRQPPGQRLFLLTSSVLEAFDLAAARVATNMADAADIMGAVDTAGLFLVHLDDQRRLFRYHHLFSDFLRSTLLRELGPTGVSDLHRRMARWYETQGDVRSAVHHSFKSGDLVHAGRLLESSGEGLLKQGAVEALRGWLEALGADRVQDSLTLLSLRGQVSEMQGDWVSATMDYERMLVRARQTDESQLPILERLALCCANYGQMERMELYIQEALQHCPAEDLAMQAHIHYWFGASLVISGRDWTRGYELLRESYQLARRSHNPTAIAATCMPYGFIYHFGQGNLAEAEKTLAEGIELYERLGRMYDAYHLMMNRAVVVLYLGSPARALSFLAQAKAVTTTFKGSFACIAYEVTLGMAYLEARDLARCRFHLEALRHQEIPFQLRLWYQKTWLLLCLVEQNLEQAYVAGQEVTDLLRLEGHGLYAPECLWALSIVLRRRGELEEAERKLTQALTLATSAKAKFWQMKAHAGLAAVGLDGRDALVHLKEAMRLSRDNAYDAFWAADLAGDTCLLALQAMAQHIEPAYARSLLLANGKAFLTTLPHVLPKLPTSLQTVACEVLGAMADPQAAELLEHIGRSKAQGVRRAAHKAIRGSADEGALRVLALGPFLIERGDQIVLTVPNRRRVLLLLKYLVCQCGRVCPDDVLVDALWPKASLESGRRSLQNHVNWLRDFLSPSRPPGDERDVIRSGQGYVLGSTLWVDVSQFEEAVAEGGRRRRNGEMALAMAAWERAVALYRGDLLMEEPYLEWLTPRRSELAQKCRATLHLLAGACAARDGHQEAVAHYQRALQMDPYDETAYHKIVESYLCLGSKAEALRSVKSLTRALEKEAGAPREDLRRYLASIKADLD